MKRRKFWVRLGVGLVVLLVLVRFVGLALVPGLIDSALQQRGFTSEIEDLDLSLFAGEFRLRGLVVRRLESEDPPLLELQHVALDLDLSSTLSGDLTCHRVELDGLVVDLRRVDELGWNFAPLLSSEGASDSEPEEAEDAEATELDLRAPIRIASLRAQDIHLRVLDTAGKEPIETELTLNVTASNIGEVARLELIADATGVLDFVRVEGSLHSTELLAESDLTFELRGFHATPIQSWLEAVGLHSSSNSIDAKGSLELQAEVSGESRETLTAVVATKGWALEADGVEALALDTSRHVVQLFPLVIQSAELSGVRARTRQEQDGALSCAGISATRSQAPDEVVEPVSRTEPAATAPFDWQLDSLAIHEAALLHEDAISATDVELRLDSLRLADLDSKLSRPATLDIHLSAPGVFEEAHIAVSLTPEQGASRAQATFDLLGLESDRCAPMLARAGIGSTFEQARAHAAFTATLQTEVLGGRFALEELWLENGDRKTEFGSLEVSEFSMADGIHIGEVLASGLRLVVEEHENGDLEVAGLVLRAGAKKSAPPPSGPVAPGAPAPSAAPFALRLDHLKFMDAQFELRNLANPAGDFVASNLELELNDFALGADSDCTIRARIDAPRWWNQLAFDGTVHSTSDAAVQAELELKLTGLNGDQVCTRSSAFGLEPTFALGDLSAGLSLVSEAAGTTVRVHDVLFASAGEPLFQLSSLNVSDVQVGEGGLAIGSVTMDEPEVRLERDLGGEWILAGMRSLAAAPQPNIARAPEPSAPQPKVATAESSTFRLGAFQLERASVLVHDELQQPAAETRFTLSASLTELQLGSQTPVEVFARLEQEGGSLACSLDGRIVPDPAAARLELHLGAEGLDGKHLNRFLPAGCALVLEEGNFQMEVRANLGALAEGGVAAGVQFLDANLSSTGEERSLLGFERVELAASRIDPAAGYFELDRLHVLGLQLDVVRAEDGALQVAGLRLGTEASVQSAPTEPAPEVEPPAAEASRAVSWARKYDESPLPTVLLNSLKLELRELRFHDRSQPNAQPAVLTALLEHEEQLVLLAPDTEALAPLEFALDGTATPLVRSFGVNMTLAPWKDEARAGVTVDVRGIRGVGLTEMLPELATQIDGSGLEDGSFGMLLEARLVTRRRNPVDFDLGNGFGFEFALRELALRNGEDPQALVGLGEFDVVVDRFNPKTGAVRIESVDVSDLVGRARFSSRGLEVLGCVLLESPADSVPTTEPAEQESAPSETYSGPEIELKRLSVTGLDFVLTDERTVPMTVLPLTSLDVDLERFTTKTLTEQQPFRFGVYLGAGGVSLPKPVKKKSLLGGLTSAALSAAVGSKDKFEYEERPAFGEVALTGSLSLGPKPKGRINANIDGFELLTISGLAQQSGVEIGGGVLDTWARVKLNGEKGIDVRSNVVFTELSLDEPPNGPISRYLKLPAPLDSVLFALENQDDEHRIPLNFSLGANGLSGAEIARVAVSTLAQIIGSAIASAPLRVGDGVAGMLVIPGMEDSPASWVMSAFRPVLVWIGLADKPGPRSTPVALDYSHGDFRVPADAAVSLKTVLREVADRDDFIVVLQHQFGTDDLERAEQLANPSPAECLRIAAGLRKRKKELLRRRSELAADAAADFAIAGAGGAKESLERLRTVEVELGHIEGALDETLVLLGPGGDRQADRRTRNAMIELAEARMEALQARIAGAMHGGTSERFEIKRPRTSMITGESSSRVHITLKVRPSE